MWGELGFLSFFFFFTVDGVIGVSLSDYSFNEENNFRISEVIMKVKKHQSEAGWVAEDDVDSEAQWVSHVMHIYWGGGNRPDYIVLVKLGPRTMQLV